MGPTYAGILGPLAFVLILARGLVDGSSADGVVWSATVCLLFFAAFGYMMGRVADQVVWDSVKKQFQDEMRAHEARQGSAENRRG